MKKLVFASAVAGMAVLSTWGYIKPAAVFSDGMVLQAHDTVPIWGMGDPEEVITVTYGDVKAEVVAGADGRWRADLPAMDYVKTGRDLKLRGSNEIVFHDVVVGEVWLGLGQSNMEYPFDLCERGKEVSKGGVFSTDIRYLHIPKDGDVKPRDMFGVPRDLRWKKYVAENRHANQQSSMLLALLAERMHKELDCPIGVIGIAAGGANLETWMSAEAIAEAGTEKDAEKLMKMCEVWRQNDIKRWKERPESEKGRFFPRINYESRPSQCWNSQVCPLAPYRVRGAIWYQGEMNTGWQLYLKQFPFFAKHLRAAFERPNMPLFIVQLPDFKGDHWPYIRNVQRLMSEEVPHAGLAVTIDGDEIELHPRDKTKLVDRLARLALVDCYGRKLIARSPYPAAAKLAGGEVTVTFKYADGGLKLGDGDSPRTFEVAGADKKFVAAAAKLAGPDAVKVAVPASVAAPKFVRYGWSPDPDVNLYNGGDLPATPFELELQ